MPPHIGSRYASCFGVKDEIGHLYLTDREPYRYRHFSDNRVHVVAHGDTLFSLAGRYFAPLPRACGYWWVIADFQNPPIIDPTLQLPLGAKIVIPSIVVLENTILGDLRGRHTS